MRKYFFLKKFLLTDEMQADQVNMIYSESPLINLENFSGGWTEVCFPLILIIIVIQISKVKFSINNVFFSIEK